MSSSNDSGWWSAEYLIRRQAAPTVDGLVDPHATKLPDRVRDRNRGWVITHDKASVAGAEVRHLASLFGKAREHQCRAQAERPGNGADEL
jgi:hypothetical protein